jgi:putative hydrolase of the HAD superfamily/5'-nucleotidase
MNVKASLVDEATRVFRQLHLDLSEAIPGVPSLLERLRRKGVTMAIVSNSFDGHTRSIMQKLGLAQFFDVMVDSSDVKAYKPMREPFDYALRGLDAEPSTALYVGDEFYADIVGAHLAGMQSVWVNSRGHSLEDSLARYGSENAPLVVLKSVSDLSSYLQ